MRASAIDSPCAIAVKAQDTKPIGKPRPDQPQLEVCKPDGFSVLVSSAIDMVDDEKGLLCFATTATAGSALTIMVEHQASGVVAPGTFFGSAARCL